MSTKKIRILNSDLLSDSSRDLFRAEVGGKWEETAEGFKYVPPSAPDLKITEIGWFNVDYAPIILTEDDIDRGVLSKIRQKVKVEFSGDARVGRAWPTWIGDRVKEGVTYTDDAAIVHSEPITEEVLNSSVDFVGDTQGVTYVYNYYDKLYELELATVTDHSVIPSMYAMLDESTIAGTQDADQGDDYLAGLGTLDIDILQAPTVDHLINNKRLRFLPSDWIVPIENNDLILDYAGSKFLFPMYNQINLVASKDNKLNNELKNTGLACILIRDLDDFGNLAGGDRDVSSVSGAFTAAPINYSVSLTNADGQQVIDNFSAVVNILDLGRWWSADLPAWTIGENPLPHSQVFVGPETLSTNMATFEVPSLIAGNIATFHDRIIDLAKDKQRMFEDILAGKDTYSETVMYRIEKYLGPADSITTTSPIQVFQVSNFGDIKQFMKQERKIRLIDTQVKYGQQYSYAVTAYHAVFGCNYSYSNLDPGDPEEWPKSAEFDVDMETYIKLIEIPLFMSSGKIMDNPPLPPQIKFIPIKGQTDTIKFLFGSNTGQSDMVPITLNSEEQADIDQIAFNQGRSDGLITYKEDDSASFFRVYRLSTPPLSYQDFDGSLLLATSTAATVSGVVLDASSATTKVTQTVNQKYYYMFRTVDIHGNLSNPSTVYEIELYSDSGVGYPIIRGYEMEEPNAQTPVKSARKIIQIIPRITQAYLNEEASGLTEDGMIKHALGNKDIVLGVEDETLFARDLPGSTKSGKRFKIRFISRTTGKKMDLNVTFKTKRVRSKVE